MHAASPTTGTKGRAAAITVRQETGGNRRDGGGLQGPAAASGHRRLRKALSYQEPESETNPGLFPRALRQTLPGVKDLGEDLVQQARAQISTLARSKEVEDIESKVTRQPPQRQETDRVGCRQGNFHWWWSNLPEEDVWLSPGSHDQH